MAEDRLAGAARAVLGQGLAMGWGDELEAMYRKYAHDEPYEPTLKKIREEYGQYSDANPWTSGIGEFVGGTLPSAAMMLVPGGQGLGAAQVGRTSMQGLAKLGALGAATGAVAGAGGATEDTRGQGALAGGTLGGVLGVAVPAAMRSGTSAYKWLAERLHPTEAKSAARATEKMLGALEREQMTPTRMEQAFRADRPSSLPYTGKPGVDVPSVLANVSQELADQAQTVIKHKNPNSRALQQKLRDQRTGTKTHAEDQIRRALNPKDDAYAEGDALADALRIKAKTAYDAAYDVGTIDDPQILSVLDTPEMYQAFSLAKKYASGKAAIAKLQGKDPSKYELPEVYKATVDPVTKAMTFEVKTLPDVRTLDYMKKALDADVKAGYLSDDASKKATAGNTQDLRNLLRDRLKDLVPEYRHALQEYAGDAEVIKALDTGLTKWSAMPFEQTQKLLTGMSKAEKEAFRTGVARNLHKQITGPTGDSNSAQLLSSVKLQERLRPLFDNPAEADLLQAALKRDAQLFEQTGKVLKGVSSGAGDLAEDKAIPTAIHRGILWGWANGLASLVTDAINKGGISEQTASKLAKMLSADSPTDVAAVVKTLEAYTAGQAPKAATRALLERGAVTGTVATVPPAPPAGDDGSTLDSKETEVPNELEMRLKAAQTE